MRLEAWACVSICSCSDKFDENICWMHCWCSTYCFHSPDSIFLLSLFFPFIWSINHVIWSSGCCATLWCFWLSFYSVSCLLWTLIEESGRFSTFSCSSQTPGVCSLYFRFHSFFCNHFRSHLHVHLRSSSFYSCCTAGPAWASIVQRVRIRPPHLPYSSIPL